MKALSLYEEFDIVTYEAKEWGFETHKHNFFEIVYVLEGSGMHILNDNGYEYTQGSLFLLTPNDYHFFEIQTFTKFCIISFNEIYFSKIKESNDFSELFKKLEIIFYTASSFQNELINNEDDKQFTDLLIKRLLSEMKNKDFLCQIVIKNSVFLLLNIIARNIQQRLSVSLKSNSLKSEIGEIIFYIQQHIYQNEKLRIAAIAEHFFKSKNYISQYFKENTGESLKEYILKCKLSLVKNRLLHSDLTISQIADELNFTDESHLNKFFKLSYQQTAKEFRKENRKL